MRRGAVAGVLFFACAVGPAFAADQAVRMPIKAAPVITGPAWSGFYVGAHVGYAFANDTYTIDPAFAAIFGVPSTNVAGSRGPSFGALAGYNWLLARRWLIGVEADASWQDIATRASAGGGAASFEDKQDWAASVRARFGYLVTPSTLAYGTAGVGWSRVKESIESAGLQQNSSANIHGLQVGLGMETVVAANWHARLEYLHTFYSSAAVDATAIAVTGIKPSVGLARVAAIYQFGSPREAVPWPEPRAAAPSWTGLYVGASIGGALGYGEASIPGAVEVKGFGLAGPLPSAFAGYNFQFAPRWLIGAEGEIAPSIRSTDLKIGWIGAARGRFGYLLTPDTLVYGTAGWIGTQIDDIFLSGILVVAGRTINGVQLGGGLESAFDAHWSARLDYQYAIMQKVDLTLPAFPGVITTVKPGGHAGRIALVYRFN